MPRPSKWGVASERMPTPYKNTRANMGANLNSIIKSAKALKVVETHGACKNTAKKVRRGSRRTRVCNQFHAVLGNGYCQDCWDKEVERLHNSAISRKKRNKIPTDETDI